MIPGFGARSGGTGPEGRTPVPVKLVLPVLLGAFGVFGLFWGAFAVLLADLSGALDLTPGPLGIALFAGAAASILAMALLGQTSDRLGVPAQDTLLTGDRLATDIRMANEAGMASALVLTGATGLDEVLRSEDRPDYVIGHLGELLPRGGESRAAARTPDRRNE